MLARIVLALALALTLLVPGQAWADDRTNFLISRLQSDDVRVRASAALALGASNDDAAVSPLCQALGDSSDAVRTAVAAALGRLGRPQGADCLKARLGVEGSATVKSQIQKAIDSL